MLFNAIAHWRKEQTDESSVCMDMWDIRFYTLPSSISRSFKTLSIYEQSSCICLCMYMCVYAWAASG